MKHQNLVIATWRGLTPLGIIAVVGLGGFAAIRTALLAGCHIREPWAACEVERSDWQKQMGMVAAGFWLLYTRAPGTSDAPAPSVTTTALPPWRRPEEESTLTSIDPAPEPLIQPAIDLIAPSAVVNPDATPASLSAAERMERAARRLKRPAE